MDGTTPGGATPHFSSPGGGQSPRGPDDGTGLLNRPPTCEGACDYLKEAGKIGAGGLCAAAALPSGVGAAVAFAGCYYLYGKAADAMYDRGDSFMY